MIYAISDCHGDFKQTIKLLREYRIINGDNDWIANDATLVCCGDSTDRGNEGIKLLKFWYEISLQAKNSGGRFIHLMGNHDALILCVALYQNDGDYDEERYSVFLQNGGKRNEATSLSTLPFLKQFVQSFPAMCRVDDILFQHADGYSLYNRISQNGTPDEKIRAANAYFKNHAQTINGAWGLFYDITDERFWQGKEDEMPAYLESFGASKVVHGHSGFKGAAPKHYMDGLVINIDAVLSHGYRDVEERGCVLAIDNPGKDIVV